MCGLSVNFHLGLGEERKGRVGRGGLLLWELCALM